MDKQLAQVIEYVLLRGLYFILFSLTLLFTVIITGDFWELMNATPAELKQFPVGQGDGDWAYSSVEAYVARGQYDAYIGWQGLIVSLVFYRQGRGNLLYKAMAVAILAAPIFFLVLTSDGTMH